MANKLGNKEYVLPQITLIIKNTAEPTPPQSFTMWGNLGSTLLDAMQNHQRNHPDFSFRTGDVPTSGPYVLDVNGVKNGQDTFWQTLLYNRVDRVVKPISLRYQINMNDIVYLQFSAL